jgi:hypothetical protein
MRKWILLLFNLMVVAALSAQTARLQAIHNSADPTVDLYVNGDLFLAGFEYRTATPFIDVPAGVELQIGVAPSPSSGPGDIIATFPATFDDGETYVAIAHGLVGSMGTPFTMSVYPLGQEAGLNGNNVDILAFHGATNAPAVDIAARGVAPLFTNISYGQFGDYIPVPADEYILDVAPAGTGNVVASFSADLNALSGGAAVVFASGFLGGNPAFGLFAALPTGDVVELPRLQLANIQVIHNSPSPTVDLWVNSNKLLENVDFRAATGFFEVSGNTPFTLGVAPSPSNSTNDIIATFDVNFLAGESYILIANGVVGDPDKPFNIEVLQGARQSSTNEEGVDILVFHGSPDAPAVDIAVRGIGNVVEDLDFSEFAGYLELPEAIDVILDIKPAGSDIVVASYAAPLSALEGLAATVFASGFLADDPAFGLFVVLPDGTVIELEQPADATARLQVIHNSPSPTVDIWVNEEPFLTGFDFRTATPFVDVPAGVELNIGIAPSPSSDPSDIIATFPVTLDADESYIVIANGIVGDMEKPFNLEIFVGGRAEATNEEGVDLLVFHGSPDAPAVDIAVRGLGDIVEALDFAQFAGYLELDGAPDVILDIKPAGSDVIVASYAAPLSALEGLAATVFASGFLADDPAFGLFVVLGDGTVIELEQPADPTARLQVIHNSPSPTVDIWVNEEPFLTGFDFRTATPFVDVPAGVELNIGIAPSPSSDPSDIIATFPVTLDADESYIVIANGIVGDMEKPFNLEIFVGGRAEATNEEGVDLLVFHGSPDAPAVDIAVRGLGDIVEALDFAQFAGYLELDGAPDVILDIKPAGSDVIVASYAAPLSALEGLAATVFASGFLADDPAFGLFVVLGDGTVIPLEALTTARVQIIHNSPSPTVDIWVNEEPFLTDFDFRTSTPFVDVPGNVDLNIGIAPSPSSDPSDIIATFPVNLLPGESYVVIANGIVGDMEKPFNLEIFVGGREVATEEEGVDLLIFHGSPDAPNVDIAIRGLGNAIEDLAFGEFVGYSESDIAPDIILDIKPAGSETVVASFLAPLSALEGLAATVFASGFLSDGLIAFGLWVALPDGTTFPLERLSDARVQIIHNSPSPTVDIWVNEEPFLTDFAFRTATPFVDVPGNTALNIGIAPSPSSDPSDIIATFPVNLLPGETYVIIANGIVGNMATPFNLEIRDGALEASGDDEEVALLVFHGSPDAPAVDVDVRNVGNLISNLAFGEFDGYAFVDEDEYILDISPAGTGNVLVSYRADLNGLGGGAATVFASGLLAGNPGFGLFAALPDGSVIELPLVTSTAQPQFFAEVTAYPNPTTDLLFVGVNTTLEGRMDMQLWDMQGRLVGTNTAFANAGQNSLTVDMSGLVDGMYILHLIPESGVPTHIRVMKQ